MSIKTYSELRSLETFEDRFNYLKIFGEIGVDTFGFDRVFNQKFYHSAEWKRIRHQIIIRDNGCDLGISDRPIKGQILIHHLNPITLEDIKNSEEKLFDPNNLICVSKITHNAIHYGYAETLPKKYEERKPNDTCLWK